VHAELGEEPDGRGAFLRHHAGDRFEAHSAGCEAAEEMHPYVEEVMREVGIDASGQRPKGLRTYMGKVGFNYSIIVCARAEKNCPKTFPGVGTRLVWIFDDPRGDDVPDEERLNKFREIRDEIEHKILDWLEHPEAELGEAPGGTPPRARGAAQDRPGSQELRRHDACRRTDRRLAAWSRCPTPPRGVTSR
jgi:arsenate reductase (thioredoxin)